MQYTGNSVSEITIAYIGGGSRGWAWGLMSDLASDENLSGTVRLYDIDADAARRNEAIGNRLSSLPETKSAWRYTAVRTLEEALSGADFVVVSILPGTFEEMRSDVHAPEEYGIYQSVGDTTGPGGLMRALRAIPMFAEIARGIRACCPDAWVINYTNPMTLCTRTLYEVFPRIKAFGCCHEVFGTQKLLAEMLAVTKGIEGVDRSEINVNVLGINHFTWIDRASYAGIDLMPIYRDFADAHRDSGYAEKETENWMNRFFRSNHRVKFDLFRRYGLIAAAGDRHLAEFMPPWYLKDPETARSWGFDLTPVSWRIEHRDELIAKGARLAAGTEPTEIRTSGEEGLKQMKAVLGLGDLITNVNIPNRGQMRGVPEGAVVETNAVFTRDSIRPVLAGELPSPVQAMVVRHVLNQETILRAVFTGNRDLAFQAFVNDPLVAIDPAAARELFDRMMEHTAAYVTI